MMTMTETDVADVLAAAATSGTAPAARRMIDAADDPPVLESLVGEDGEAEVMKMTGTSRGLSVSPEASLALTRGLGLEQAVPEMAITLPLPPIIQRKRCIGDTPLQDLTPDLHQGPTHDLGPGHGLGINLEVVKQNVSDLCLALVERKLCF